MRAWLALALISLSGSAAADVSRHVQQCNHAVDETGVKSCTVLLKSYPAEDEVKAGFLDSRANAYYRMGKYLRAIADFTHAIKIRPNEARYYYSRALAWSLIKGHQQAIADYSRYLKLSPRDNATATVLARAVQHLTEAYPAFSK